MGASAFVVLGLLLAVPAYALGRLTPWVDWRVLAGALLAVSAFTFFAYRSDKLRAEAGAWRIPESTLQLAAFAGGWPGAFLAQRWFRHKTSKTSFRVVFWLVVAAHQLVAVDSLWGWRLAKETVRGIQSLVG